MELTRSASQSSTQHSVWCMNRSLRVPRVLFNLVWKTFDYAEHEHLLNLMRFMCSNFSNLSRCLWMTFHPSGLSAAPLSLESSANFLRVHLVPVSVSLMKILNSTGPKQTPGRHHLSLMPIWPWSCWLLPSCNSWGAVPGQLLFVAHPTPTLLEERLG